MFKVRVEVRVEVTAFRGIGAPGNRPFEASGPSADLRACLERLGLVPAAQVGHRPHAPGPRDEGVGAPLGPAQQLRPPPPHAGRPELGDPAMPGGKDLGPPGRRRGQLLGSAVALHGAENAGQERVEDPRLGRRRLALFGLGPVPAAGEPLEARHLALQPRRHHDFCRLDHCAASLAGASAAVTSAAAASAAAASAAAASAAAASSSTFAAFVAVASVASALALPSATTLPWIGVPISTTASRRGARARRTLGH